MVRVNMYARNVNPNSDFWKAAQKLQPAHDEIAVRYEPRMFIGDVDCRRIRHKVICRFGRPAASKSFAFEFKDDGSDEDFNQIVKDTQTQINHCIWRQEVVNIGW